MNAETFAEWYRRQGYAIVRTKSSFWYNAGPGVLQAFPYHWLIQPDKGEINRLLTGSKKVAVRFSTPLNAREGMVSYHVTLKGPYAMKDLRSQARNGVRRDIALAAGEQGKFWEMHDLLFDNQDELDPHDLSGYAAQLGLDVDAFNAELREGRHGPRVAQDVNSAEDAGVADNGVEAAIVKYTGVEEGSRMFNVILDEYKKLG